MFSLSKVNKIYGKKEVVCDFSCNIPNGKIIGFLGPNGAGKTTVMRMLNFITRPDKGEITFDGHLVSEKDLPKIGYMPEEKGLYPAMKVFEQLMYFGLLHGLKKSDLIKKIEYWLQKFEMTEYRDTKLSALSKGNAQKIQFIVTILHDPEFIILDEPLSGLDPINSTLINQTITELRNSGKTILFSTHRMEQVEELCDYIILINNGKKVIEGNLDEIKNSFNQRKLQIELTNTYNPQDFDQSGFNVNKVSGREIIIDLEDDQTSTQVLQYCLNQNLEIMSFKRLLPSVKEIFLSYV
jgi:ABC-2 type transport system ATP-binding protein